MFELVLQALCLVFAIAFFFKQRTKFGTLELYLILYVYFFMGPVLAIYLGLPVYKGIEQAYLGIATQIFFASLVGIWIGTIIPLAKSNGFDIAPVRVSGKIVRQLTLIPAQLILVFGLVLLVNRGLAFSMLDKTSTIQSIGWGHYPTMTFVPCFLIVYMTFTKASDGIPREFWATLLLFIAYSVLTDERDFILFIVPAYFWIVGFKSVKLRHVVPLALPSAAVFSFLAKGRSEIFDGSSISSFINQGSNLMVLTQTASFIDTGGEHIYGLSYLSAILNALTLGIVNLWGPGASWLAILYADGEGAYGFSLEAEAYLNFGTLGVVFFFTLLARYHKSIDRLAASGSQLGMLLKLHFAYFLIYGIRGEFLTILKSAEYCLFIYLFVAVIMSRGRLRTRVYL
jgi:hypothetical protein